MRGEAAGRGLREDGLEAWERIMHVSAEGELPKKVTSPDWLEEPGGSRCEHKADQE